MAKEAYPTKPPEDISEFQEYIGLARQNGEISWLMEEFLSRNPHLDPDKSKFPVHKGSVQYFEDVLSEKAEIENSLEQKLKVKPKNLANRAYRHPVIKAVGSIAAAGVMIGAAVLGALKGKDYSAKGPAKPVVDFSGELNGVPVGINYNDGDQEFPDIYGNDVIYENGSHIEGYNIVTQQKFELGQGSLGRASANYLAWRDLNHNLTIYTKSTQTNITLDQKILGFDLEDEYIIFESFNSPRRIGAYHIPSGQLNWVSDEMFQDRIIFTEPVKDGSNLAWINLDESNYEIYSLTTGATVERPLSHGRNSIPFQFDLSGSKLVTPETRGLIIEDIQTGDITEIQLDNTPAAAYFLGTDIYFPITVPGNSGIYKYDTITDELTQIQTSSSIRWMNVDAQNEKVVWSAKLDYTPDHDIYVLDLSGPLVSPIGSLTPEDIRISESSQLSYDPNDPAKFVLHAMFGSEGDSEFDYVKSDLTLFIETNEPVSSVYLYLQKENGGGIDVYPMLASGSNPGELVFGGHVEESTESTLRIYSQEFLFELLTGGEPGGALVKGTVLGSLKVTMEDWQDVYLDKVWVDGQIIDIPDHTLSSIANDPNIWQSQTEEFVVASPVDLEVQKNGDAVNYDSNVVYSGPDEHPEFVLIFNPSGKYVAKITGTDDGVYTFVHRKVDGLTVTYEDIKRAVPIEKGEVHINGEPQKSIEDLFSSNALWAVPAIAVGAGGAVIGYRMLRKKDGEPEESDEPVEALDWEEYIDQRDSLWEEVNSIESRLDELKKIQTELTKSN